MKIMDYQIGQQGSSKIEETVLQSKAIKVNMRNVGNGENTLNPLSIDSRDYELELKNEQIEEATEVEDENNSTLIMLLEAMLSNLRGEKVKLENPSINLNLKGTGTSQSNFLSNSSITYEEVEIYERKESVSFSSAGSVNTADGRSISFKFDMNMKRHFQSSRTSSVTLGNQVDPLVVAFGGNVPDLSITKHEFDLDSDGEMDSISMPTNGSGFLAYDKDGNGLIDNGNELFGTQSGNGFEDLRVYDSDGNGWIDESDDIFSKLSIMTTQGGEKALFKLADVGIGAIYLNGVDTEFNMTHGNDTQGTMRSSSVFLRENGTAGSIHHIDLNV